MHFISMDLIGEIHPKSSAVTYYALTVTYMLTGCTLCIGLKSKSAKEFVQTYIDNVYTKFDGSICICQAMVLNFEMNCSQMWQYNWQWDTTYIHFTITHGQIGK